MLCAVMLSTSAMYRGARLACLEIAFTLYILQADEGRVRALSPPTTRDGNT